MITPTYISGELEIARRELPDVNIGDAIYVKWNGTLMRGHVISVNDEIVLVICDSRNGA